jgi:hypothetical protein
MVEQKVKREREQVGDGERGGRMEGGWKRREGEGDSRRGRVRDHTHDPSWLGSLNGEHVSCGFYGKGSELREFNPFSSVFPVLLSLSHGIVSETVRACVSN